VVVTESLSFFRCVFNIACHYRGSCSFAISFHSFRELVENVNSLVDVTSQSEPNKYRVLQVSLNLKISRPTTIERKEKKEKQYHDNNTPGYSLLRTRAPPHRRIYPLRLFSPSTVFISVIKIHRL